MRRSFWLPVACAAAIAAAALVFWAGPRPRAPEGFEESPPRQPRAVSGVVLQDGRPRPGARVRLFENARDGFAAERETGVDGLFAFEWRPTATDDPRRLRLAVRTDDVLAVVSARPGHNEVRLGAPARVRGVVLDRAGDPLAGATVIVAPRGCADSETCEADHAGNFASPRPLARGTPLLLVARAPGYALHVERRFVAGDPLTLHLARGRPVELELRDPAGRAVAGASARIELPPLCGAVAFAEGDATGRMRLDDASDGSQQLVEIEAEGYLPAVAPAWPGIVNRVVLWPARGADLLAWDAWNRTGVERASLSEVEIRPDGGEWWGGTVGRVEHRFGFRPLGRVGLYRARLPACALRLTLAAPGYGEAAGALPADRTRLALRLQPPVSRGRPGRLELRAADHEGALPLVVADPKSGWHSLAMLKDGRARLDVLPGVQLRVASARAADGVWVPRQELEPVPHGARRSVRLALRPATRLRIRTEPAVAGEAFVTDLAYAKLLDPLRVELVDGRASCWVRPLREVRVRVEPRSNHYAHEGEFVSEQSDMEWVARLRAAAGVRFTVRDATGHPVPFAVLRLWEPGRGGRLELRRLPVEARTGARGFAELTRLRAGTAAAEIEAEGFRILRLAGLRLEEAEVLEGGEHVLEPAPLVRGRLRAAPETGVEGFAGVGVRVIAPEVAFLPLPGGGARLLYDLVSDSRIQAITDDAGDFEVRDAAPRDPLLGVHPRGRPRLAPAVFDLPGPEGADLVLPPAAFLELVVPSGSLAGVYLLLPDSRRAVLVRTDPPMGLRPVPVVVPAGKHTLFVRMRDGRWASPVVELKPGEKRSLAPRFRR